MAEKQKLSHIGHILRKSPGAMARRSTKFRESLLTYCRQRAIYNAKMKSFGGARKNFDELAIWRGDLRLNPNL